MNDARQLFNDLKRALTMALGFNALDALVKCPTVGKSF